MEVRFNFLLGDVNRDGSVDLLDVVPFIDVVTNGSNDPAADINGDNAVNLLDVAPFVGLLTVDSLPRCIGWPTGRRCGADRGASAGGLDLESRSLSKSAGFSLSSLSNCS